MLTENKSKDLEEHDLTTDQEWNDWFQVGSAFLY